MESDIRRTAHRRLGTAFESAAKSWSEGAQQVTIEWDYQGAIGSKQYAFEKTIDGIYARVRGITDATELMKVHNFALALRLPFSPTASWSRTD